MNRNSIMSLWGKGTEHSDYIGSKYILIDIIACNVDLIGNVEGT